jgi:Zn-dependent M28 family amino/carboxypeptidase
MLPRGWLVAIALFILGCHTPPDERDVFAAVSSASLEARLEELTGAREVTAGGQSFRITDRWSPDAKARFRSYWTELFTQLGATVEEQTFPIPDLVGETTGHNLEAVLPGKSADSIVIIVHYDTVGVDGHEADNPGADDDGSGLAMELEAGRIFAQHPERDLTVRFVAADYEEISDNLDGDYAYRDHLLAQATAQGFQVVAVSDDDQTGWSCWGEGLCGKKPPRARSTFQVIACSGDKHGYDHPELSEGMVAAAARYGSPLVPVTPCDGSGDTDHYPFWEAGIPAYVIEEYGANNNPHFDDDGDDTLAHIDLGLLTDIARVQIAYQAELAGVR